LAVQRIAKMFRPQEFGHALIGGVVTRIAPTTPCSASKLCGGSRRRMSSAGRAGAVTFDESFIGSMASLVKHERVR